MKLLEETLHAKGMKNQAVREFRKGERRTELQKVLTSTTLDSKDLWTTIYHLGQLLHIVYGST